MQQIYELSLTPTYVSDWDFKMAIRELIQNGIDQQATNSKCTFSMEFVPNENDSTRGKILFTSTDTISNLNTLDWNAIVNRVIHGWHKILLQRWCLKL